MAGFDGLETSFAQRLQDLVNASGGRIWIVSGYRSVEEQEALWAEAVAQYGPDEARNWVAPPGKSNHNRGFAADLDGDLDLAHQLAPQFGLSFPMGHEPWHIEPADLRSNPDAYTPTPAPRGQAGEGGFNVQENTTGRQINEEPEDNDPFAALLRLLGVDVGSVSNIGRRINDRFLRPTEHSVIPGAPGPGNPASPASLPARSGGGGGGFDDWLNEIAAIAGMDESEKEAMRTVAQYESGFRNVLQEIQDVNSGGNEAMGPWQIIPGTFESNKWGDEFGDRNNPVHSGLAAYNYMRNVYGSAKTVADRFVRTGKGGY